MIRFIVNNIELVLPEELSITVIDENPVVTRNGEFSFDIPVSLLEGNNAKAFQMQQRLNVKNVLRTAQAVMIDNLRTVAGKAVVLPGTTNEKLTFQFVAGNSELNYLSQEQGKIWELDFGTVPSINYYDALFTIQNPGYGPVMSGESQIGFNRFCCVPVKYSNMIVNDYQVSTSVVVQDAPSVPGEIEGVENIQMMPYLMHYIEQLPVLLGFTLAHNALMEDELARQLFVTTKVQSLNFSDALPDISIGEFVSAIEEFFNVFFYISADKKCYILNVDSYLEDRALINLRDVDDVFERNISENEISTTSVAYELSGEGFHKYQKIDPEIIKVCTKLSYPTTFHMKNQVHPVDINKFIVHTTTNNNREYLFTPPPELNLYRVLLSGTNGVCSYVNKFKNYGVDENPLVLNISPLPYTYADKQIWIWDFNVTTLVPRPYQMPLENYVIHNSNSQNILEAVEGTIEKLPRKNRIEVGIYSGMVILADGDPPVLYPISYLDNHPDFFVPPALDAWFLQSSFNSWITEHYKPTCKYTLRLNGADGIYQRYFINPRYDKSVEYVFTMPEQEGLSTDNLFMHNNQLYIPIRFERIKAKKSSLVKGYFYRMLS